MACRAFIRVHKSVSSAFGSAFSFRRLKKHIRKIPLSNAFARRRDAAARFCISVKIPREFPRDKIRLYLHI